MLSDYLTRHGIAVLRADDRGFAKSTGTFATATTADFATDAEAGVAYLKSRPDVAGPIGLIGHSEGGIIAPMVAARNPEVAFIVMMAGSGVRGDELLVMQGELDFGGEWRLARGCGEKCCHRAQGFGDREQGRTLP